MSASSTSSIEILICPKCEHGDRLAWYFDFMGTPEWEEAEPKCRCSSCGRIWEEWECIVTSNNN